jgi:hypothetical protein
MVFEMFFVRRAYTQVLAHELKKVVRMLRAFPVERLDEREAGCGVSARELAMGFVHHVRRIDGIAYGCHAHPMRVKTPSRGEILLALESAFLGAHAALGSLPPSRWSEIVPAPEGFTPLLHARRGELLWLALRELIRHDRHFALHLRGAGHSGGGGTIAVAPAPEPTRELAVGV